jgi:acyl carrier protein
MNSLEELNSVFREVFDDESIRIKPETVAGDILGWDSLSHINLIVAVETRFRIKFSDRDIFGFKNVGDLYKAVQRKIGEV